MEATEATEEATEEAAAATEVTEEDAAASEATAEAPTSLWMRTIRTPRRATSVCSREQSRSCDRP